jgi:threonine synthase
MALQLLPHLMTAAIRKTGETSQVCILTATSGDTGKAALEGFSGVEGTQVIVFYPSKGVSEIQRLQMVTTEGANCHVLAVEGSFDDAQSGVKTIFNDKSLAEELQGKGVLLSSANSINWGRWHRKLSIISQLMQICWPGKKSNPVRRSTSLSRQEISAISCGLVCPGHGFAGQ